MQRFSAFRHHLLSTVNHSHPAFNAVPSPREWHQLHMRMGFELGFLKVVIDEAHKKATRRSRDIVVYTTPKERGEQHLLK